MQFAGVVLTKTHFAPLTFGPIVRRKFFERGGYPMPDGKTKKNVKKVVLAY
jgi:hypothetical protein